MSLLNQFGREKKYIDDEADNNVEVTEDNLHNEIEYEGNRSIEMTADELLTSE